MSLRLKRESGDTRRIAFAENMLGDIARETRNFARATAHYRNGLTLFRELNDRWATSECLEDYASLASKRGKISARRGAIRRRVALRDALGAAFSPADRADYAAMVAAVPARMTADRFRAAWRRGRTQPLSESIDLALASPFSWARRSKLTGPLTARQVDVLRLVALGRTDRQIATELVVSTKPVSRHLENIYAVLGVSSWTSASLEAMRRGLIASAGHDDSAGSGGIG